MMLFLFDFYAIRLFERCESHTHSLFLAGWLSLHNGHSFIKLFFSILSGGHAQSTLYLWHRSIPHELLLKINNSLEQDRMIRAIHDVKGIDMGNSLIRYKAEIDIDGRELTRRYLDSMDLEILLEVRSLFFRWHVIK